jgi:hypothetical protein
MVEVIQTVQSHTDGAKGEMQQQHVGALLSGVTTQTTKYILFSTIKGLPKHMGRLS